MSNPTIEILASAGLGGGELVGIELAEALQNRGRRASVWVPGSGMAYQNVIARGIDAKIVPYGPATSKMKMPASFSLFKTWIALKRANPAIVHVHSPIVYGAISQALNARNNCIAHVHIDYTPECFQWCFQRPPKMIITCAQFLSHKVCQSLSDNVLARIRIEAVSNAVNTERFVPRDRAIARKKLKADPNAKIILMLANLAPHKGQETAVRCTSLLKKQGCNVQCWLAGIERDNDRFSKQLEALAGNLGVADDVQFLGFRNDSETLLHACDYLLLPSTHEGLPLTILEAQATKRLVIAAPTAGIPEVVADGETGFLVCADDPEGYAKRIQQLISQPDLYDEITTRAYQQIQSRHTWSAYTDRILGIYDDLR